MPIERLHDDCIQRLPFGAQGVLQLRLDASLPRELRAVQHLGQRASGQLPRMAYIHNSVRHTSDAQHHLGGEANSVSWPRETPCSRNAQPPHLHVQRRLELLQHKQVDARLFFVDSWIVGHSAIVHRLLLCA